MKTKAKLNYFDLTKVILNPNDYCEDEKCNNTLKTRLCTIEHALEYCENVNYRKSRDDKDEKIRNIMNKVDKKSHEKNIQFNDSKISEKTIEFNEMQKLKIKFGNKIIEKEIVEKKNLKIKNRYHEEEKNKLDALIKIGVTTESNKQRREDYINKRVNEKDGRNRILENNYKFNNRIFITKQELQYLQLERNCKKKKDLIKEIIQVKVEHARYVINEYYKKKFQKCIAENINISRLLLPNRILMNGNNG
jgi:hypothetical protein